MTHASDTSPRNGENVSEDRYDQQDATVAFFSLYESLVQDHYVQAVNAVEEGEYSRARYELERIQTDLEVLRELIER